jgi:hypothetical protein
MLLDVDAQTTTECARNEGIACGEPWHRGVTCAVCALPIPKEENEFEIEFAHNGYNPGSTSPTFTFRCFAAWEFEHRNVLHDRYRLPTTRPNQARPHGSFAGRHSRTPAVG